MKQCETCGERIAPESRICPYCETLQSVSTLHVRTAPPLRTLNIEVGLPTVDEALQRLSIQLSRARTDGVRLVRVIHGWGSASGGGGKIRTAARSWIRQQAQTGSIRFYLFGDHYTPSSPEGRDFLRRHPALRAEERQDRQNPGITFVEPAPIGQARM